MDGALREAELAVIHCDRVKHRLRLGSERVIWTDAEPHALKEPSAFTNVSVSVEVAHDECASASYCFMHKVVQELRSDTVVSHGRTDKDPV